MANFPTSDHVVLTPSPTLCAQIHSSPFSCALVQAGRVVWRLCSIRMRDIHDLWHSLSAAQVVESSSERCRCLLRYPSAQLQADFFVERDGLRVEVSARVMGEQFKLSAPAAHAMGSLNGDPACVRVQVEPDRECDLIWSPALS